MPFSFIEDEALRAKVESAHTGIVTDLNDKFTADLDEKLKAAGIDGEQDAVNDVLARLKGGNANP